MASRFRVDKSKSFPGFARIRATGPDIGVGSSAHARGWSPAGLVACRRLRQPPLNVTVPIVLLSAMNAETERELVVEAGANDMWAKPFDLEVFRRRVGELLKPTHSSGNPQGK